MKDIPERIDGLSQDRQRLVERLLKKKGVRIPPRASAVAQPEARTESHQLSHDQSGISQPKHETGRFYNAINQSLDASIFGESSFYLNLGYIPNENRQYATIELPEHLLDKNSIKLVLETIGDFDLTDADVLDVGCGRGGTIFTITRFFKIKSAAGLDLSSAAIEFCNQHHQIPGVRFLQGDAEHLPFADSSFDAVTNVESSCHYPNIGAFYREVSRVLHDGGAFLYTDYFPTHERVAECLALLNRQQLAIERCQDITANVMLSCDQIAARRLEAYGQETGAISHFLAAPGSLPYEEMKLGRATYQVFRLRKRN